MRLSQMLCQRMRLSTRSLVHQSPSLSNKLIVSLIDQQKTLEATELMADLAQLDVLMYPSTLARVVDAVCEDRHTDIAIAERLIDRLDPTSIKSHKLLQKMSAGHRIRGNANEAMKWERYADYYDKIRSFSKYTDARKQRQTINDVLKLFTEVCDQDIRITPDLCNSILILAVLTGSSWEQILGLQNLMQRAGVPLTDDICVTLVRAMSTSGVGIRAKKFAFPQKMHDLINNICARPPLSENHYARMLVALSRGDGTCKSNAYACLRILETMMLTHGILPNITTFKQILSMCKSDPTFTSMIQLFNIIIGHHSAESVAPFLELWLREYFTQRNSFITSTYLTNQLSDSKSPLFSIVCKIISKPDFNSASANNTLLQIDRIINIIVPKLLELGTDNRIHPKLCNLILSQLGLFYRNQREARKFFEKIVGIPDKYGHCVNGLVKFVDEDIAWTWIRCLMWWDEFEEALHFSTEKYVMLRIDPNGPKCVLQLLADWLIKQGMTDDHDNFVKFWRKRVVFIR